jgi:hypothetical protein
VPIEIKFGNFTKYARRQKIARFLTQHEIFKKQIQIKGSVVECGVHHGSGIMAWAKISSTLEPYNYHRKVIGFDTFSGFPSVSAIDNEGKDKKNSNKGDFSAGYDVFAELLEVIKEYDNNRFINHIEKIELVKGDATNTIPEYVKRNKHLVISLLFLDFDLYAPTVTALEHFLPRMPKGAVLAFDELNNSHWPGETVALLEKFNLNKYKIECFEYEPNVSFIIL